MINCISIVVDYYTVSLYVSIILYIYDLWLLQCVHIIRIYIFRGHIKLIDKFVVFGSFLMWIDLDKCKLDRCEILFTITKMRRSMKKSTHLKHMNERITQIKINTKNKKTNTNRIKSKNVSKIRSRIIYMYVHI